MIARLHTDKVRPTRQPDRDLVLALVLVLILLTLAALGYAIYGAHLAQACTVSIG